MELGVEAGPAGDTRRWCARAIPMTAWLKIVAWRHARTGPTGGARQGGGSVCVCVFAGKILALMLRIKVPVLPVKNDITPTGGRPNSSRSSVFPAGIFRGSLNEYS